MGYSLNLGTVDTQPLASITGWSDVTEWSQSADESEYAELLHLIDHGWADDLPALESQAAQAAGDADGSVKTTLANLAALLKNRPKAIASVSVTDGMGPDDGEPEDWLPSSVDPTPDDGPCECKEGQKCACGGLRAKQPLQMNLPPFLRRVW